MVATTTKLKGSSIKNNNLGQGLKRMPSLKKKDQKMSSKLKAETRKWFAILKTGEILTLAASTVGAYFYGVLFYWLLGWALPNWFVVWLVGWTMLGATALVLYGIYKVLGGWIKVNWKWAEDIARSRLNE